MACHLYLLAASNTDDAPAIRQKIHEIEYLNERAQKAEAFLDRGADFLSSKRYNDALYKLKEALRLVPEKGEVHSFLAEANLGAKQYKDVATTAGTLTLLRMDL